MLAALIDGRSRTATELAYHAGVSPQTASSHLAKLVQARLLAMEAEGRFRHYRLAGPNVGHAIEALLALAGDGERYRKGPTKGIEPIRIARTCYDHLAGRLGVALTHMMVKRKLLKPSGRDFRLTPSGEKFLRKFGVDVEKAKHPRRAFARQCRDWTERRPHLAGALGAALAARWLELRWVTRVPEERYLIVTNRGRTALKGLFSIKPSDIFM